jgi:hypothetical protein
MFHRVTIIGFVGQNPQMRYAPNGTPATVFSVATRQVVSKERFAGCPTGRKESLHGKNWELMTLRLRSGQALVQGDGLTQPGRSSEPVPGKGFADLCRGRALWRGQRRQPEPADLAGERWRAPGQL